MRNQDIQGFVASLGYPCSYYQFEKETAVPPPFICWYLDGDADLHADNINYQYIRPLVIEFYTDAKDFAGEAAIEAAISGAGYSFSKDEEYIESERMHLTVYNMEVVING